MRRVFVYLYLLIKRFLKMPAYLILLAMVPLAALGLSLAAKEDSGILRIVAFQESESDEAATRAMERLLSMDTVLEISEVDSEQTARNLVETGRADAAWIFPEGFDEKLEKYSLKGWTNLGIIRVYEREESQELLLARIRLFTAVFPDIAYDLYSESVDEANEASVKAPLSDEEARELFAKYHVDEDMFEKTTCILQQDTSDYLSAPLRGLLCILVTIAGLASLLFFMNDEEEGAFAKVFHCHRKYLAAFYVVAGSLPVAMCSMMALVFAGQFGNPGREIGVGILFLMDSVVFCLCFKKLINSKAGMAALLPFMSILLIIVTPVFFYLGKLRGMQLLLPGYYYLNLMADGSYLMPLVAHLSVMCLFLLIADRAFVRDKWQ